MTLTTVRCAMCGATEHTTDVEGLVLEGWDRNYDGTLWRCHRRACRARVRELRQRAREERR